MTEEEKRKRRLEALRRWRENNKEKARESQAKWRAANKERVRAQSRLRHLATYQSKKDEIFRRVLAWRTENKDKTKEYNKRWKDRNPEKAAQSTRERASRWREKNPHAVRSYDANRRAAKINATPAWANKGKISAIYALAVAYRRCGLDVHVDHIVPLRGKTVRGLHVESNLQLLFGSDNARKSNKEWPDRP